MTDEEKNEIINAIRAESVDVNDLEKVETLDDATSLPATQNGKVVTVPISLLAKPAIDAAANADAAAEHAEEEANKATEAAVLAKKAAEEAQSVSSVFESKLEKEISDRQIADTENKNLIEGDPETVKNNIRNPFTYLGNFDTWTEIQAELDKLHSQGEDNTKVGEFRMQLNNRNLIVHNYVQSWETGIFTQTIQGSIQWNAETQIMDQFLNIKTYERRYNEGTGWTTWEEGTAKIELAQELSTEEGSENKAISQKVVSEEVRILSAANDSLYNYGILPIKYIHEGKYWSGVSLKDNSSYLASEEIDISRFAGKTIGIYRKTTIQFDYIKKTDGTAVALSSLITNYNTDIICNGILPSDAQSLLVSTKNTDVKGVFFFPDAEFLLTSKEAQQNAYIKPDGTIASNSPFRLYGAYPITMFSKIYINNYIVNTQLIHIAVYDKDDIFLGGVDDESVTSTTKEYDVTDLIIKYPTAEYIRFCGKGGLESFSGIYDYINIFKGIPAICDILISSYSEFKDLYSYINDNLNLTDYRYKYNRDDYYAYNKTYGYIHVDMLKNNNPVVLTKFYYAAPSVDIILYDRNLRLLENHALEAQPEPEGAVNNTRFEITREYLEGINPKVYFFMVNIKPGNGGYIAEISYKVKTRNLYIEPYIDPDLFEQVYIAIGDSTTQGFGQGPEFSGDNYVILVGEKYEMKYLNDGRAGTSVKSSINDNRTIGFYDETDEPLDAQNIVFLYGDKPNWQFTTPNDCTKIRVNLKYNSDFDNTSTIKISEGSVIGANIITEVAKEGYIDAFGFVKSSQTSLYIECDVQPNTVYTMYYENVPEITGNGFVDRFKTVINDFLLENPTEEPLITIYGGTNDMDLNTIGKPEQINVKTFYGAYNYMLKAIYDMLPQVKLGIMTINTPMWSNKPNSEEIAKEINIAIRNIGEKWATPVLDLAKESGLPRKGLMDAESYKYLSSDGVHYSKYSYAKLARKIECFLKKL